MALVVVGAAANEVDAAPKHHATTKKKTSKKHKRAELPLRLEKVATPAGSQMVPGESISNQGSDRRCVSEEDEPAPSPIKLRVGSRKLTVELGPESQHVTVSDGKKTLWTRYVGSAGGASATSACSNPGWRVVIAGHYRHGYDVFDLLTGKQLGPGEVAAYAPDMSWGLVPPQRSWATSGFQIARTYRVLMDGSKRPYPLDTPPVARDEDHDGTDAPRVAISHDGKRYAIASSIEIGLYDAKTDKKIARLPRPPMTEEQRETNDTRLDFSKSDRYVVLSHDWLYDKQGAPAEPSEAHWYKAVSR